MWSHCFRSMGDGGRFLKLTTPCCGTASRSIERFVNLLCPTSTSIFLMMDARHSVLFHAPLISLGFTDEIGWGMNKTCGTSSMRLTPRRTPTSFVLVKETRYVGRTRSKLQPANLHNGNKQKHPERGCLTTKSKGVFVVRRVGFEPTAKRLRVSCSTPELPTRERQQYANSIDVRQDFG